MGRVLQGTPITLNVYASEVLHVAASPQGAARVWQLSDSVGEADLGVVPVDGGKTVSIGPFTHTTRFKIEAVEGELTYDTTKVEYPASVFVDRINTPLRQAASAAIGGKKMALAEKLKAFAERSHALPGQISDRVDAVSARLDKIEKRAEASISGHESVADDLEKGVAATEDALNQLTNGAPL